jgi:FkbM family methyltransferase
LATYDLLVKSNKSPVFNAHPFGLGDEEGQRLLYSHGVGDVGASFVDWQLATEWESGSQATSCQIRRGDSFLENIGSSKVTLLKIDVEGYELQVLRGFGKRIRDVRCIQFEYGVPNIHSRTLLRDLVLYLESLGFMVGRIFPKGVRFGRWSPVSERFMGNNYVAVGNEDENLITSLQGLFNNSRDSHAL